MDKTVKTWGQELFDYMQAEHGVSLLGSDIHEIELIVARMQAANREHESARRAESCSLRRLVRRIPVDFRAVAEEAGLTRGKLCHSPIFGWCVQNTHGDPGQDVATITAPELAPGEVWLAVEEGHWCFYAPNDPKLSDGGAWRGSCEGGTKDSIQTTEKGGPK